MSNTKRITTSGQIFTDRGVIEVISLSANSQNSFADVYDGLYTNGITSGTHLWHIKALANSYECTPILTVPYKKGIFAMIAGTGAGIEVSTR